MSNIGKHCMQLRSWLVIDNRYQPSYLCRDIFTVSTVTMLDFFKDAVHIRKELAQGEVTRESKMWRTDWMF